MDYLKKLLFYYAFSSPVTHNMLVSNFGHSYAIFLLQYMDGEFWERI